MIFLLWTIVSVSIVVNTFRFLGRLSDINEWFRLTWSLRRKRLATLTPELRAALSANSEAVDALLTVERFIEEKRVGDSYPAFDPPRSKPGVQRRFSEMNIADYAYLGSLVLPWVFMFAAVALGLALASLVGAVLLEGLLNYALSSRPEPSVEKEYHAVFMIVLLWMSPKLARVISSSTSDAPPDSVVQRVDALLDFNKL